MLVVFRHGNYSIRPAGFYNLLKNVVAKESKANDNPSDPSNKVKSDNLMAATKKYSFALTIPTSLYKLPDRPSENGNRIIHLLQKTYG